MNHPIVITLRLGLEDQCIGVTLPQLRELGRVQQVRQAVIALRCEVACPIHQLLLNCFRNLQRLHLFVPGGDFDIGNSLTNVHTFSIMSEGEATVVLRSYLNLLGASPLRTVELSSNVRIVDDFPVQVKTLTCYFTEDVVIPERCALERLYAFGNGNVTVTIFNPHLLALRCEDVEVRLKGRGFIGIPTDAPDLSPHVRIMGGQRVLAHRFEEDATIHRTIDRFHAFGDGVEHVVTLVDARTASLQFEGVTVVLPGLGFLGDPRLGFLGREGDDSSSDESEVETSDSLC